MPQATCDDYNNCGFESCRKVVVVVLLGNYSLFDLMESMASTWVIELSKEILG